jgi:hypothetical protein
MEYRQMLLSKRPHLELAACLFFAGLFISALTVSLAYHI